MKNLFTLFVFATLLFSFLACTEEESHDYTTYDVSVRLVAPAEITETPFEGVEIQAHGNTGLTLKAKTNALGIASFSLPEDIYNFSASHKFTEGGTVFQVNYQLQRAVTRQDFVNTASLVLEMTPVLSHGGKQIISSSDMRIRTRIRNISILGANRDSDMRFRNSYPAL